jgi:hypothetical protein
MLLELAAQQSQMAVLGSNAARLVDQGEALGIAFPGVDFDFVAGFDTLVRVFDPKYYEDMDQALERFFARHRLIATNRAQATAAAVRDFLDEPGVRPYHERIIVRELDLFHASLSSTNARDGHAEALHDEVAAYIARHGLYGTEGRRRSED